jgi:hypothetical protein
LKREILSEIKRQGVRIDESKLTEVNLIKRMVMKKCIYGVDLNDMAVELAKLSLWLDSFTLGAPLSFLDHHLKCGNSLIGVFDISDVIIPGSEMYGQVQRALSYMLQVSELTDATVSEAKTSYDLFKKGREAIAPLMRRFDASTAKHFMDTGWNPRIEQLAYTLNFEGEPFAEVVEKCKKALMIAGENRFFHWKVEFPEVFYTDKGEKENPGFDCTVGNPPYGLASEKTYIKNNFIATSKNYDLYTAFIEQGQRLLKNLGIHSYIVPVSWETGSSFEALRNMFLEKCAFKMILNLPYNVFEDAYIDTSIFVAQKRLNEKTDHLVFVYEFPKHAKIEDLTAIDYLKINQFSWQNSEQKKILLNIKAASLVSNLHGANFARISDVTESARGVLAKPEDISDSHRQEMQPFFEGEMFRYEMTLPDKFISYGDNLVEAPASFDFFSGSRVLVRRLVSRQDRLMAHAVADTFVNKKDIYIFKSQDHISHYYLSSLLNSKLLSYIYLSNDVVAQKDDFRQTTLEGLRNLPIPRIFFTTPSKERKEFFKEAVNLYKASKHEDIMKWAEYELAMGRNDTVHDFLAYLAEQMVELNRKKNEEIIKFLKYITRRIEREIESLKNKTKIKEYYKGSFNTLVKILEQNKIRLSMEDESRLEEAFSQSFNRLKPLIENIDATDNLIDQIVYKLYNLTSEEIEIVEGRR